MKPRLVLLHGFTGSPASWAPVVALLDRELELDLIVPPLVGHDPAAPRVASFDEEVARLVAVACAADDDVAAVHLAGYSLGARLALAMLIAAPGRFESATLIGVNPGLENDDERADRRSADRRWIDLLERGIVPFVDEWEKQPLWATQSRLPEEIRAAQRAERLAHDPHGLQDSLRATGLAEMLDLRPRLPLLVSPVTLMTGAEDPKFLSLAQETAALLPHARLVVVPDAGHNLLLERPEAVALELNRMIR